MEKSKIADHANTLFACISTITSIVGVIIALKQGGSNLNIPIELLAEAQVKQYGNALLVGNLGIVFAVYASVTVLLGSLTRWLWTKNRIVATISSVILATMASTVVFVALRCAPPRPLTSEFLKEFKDLLYYGVLVGFMATNVPMFLGVATTAVQNTKDDDTGAIDWVAGTVFSALIPVAIWGAFFGEGINRVFNLFFK